MVEIHSVKARHSVLACLAVAALATTSLAHAETTLEKIKRQGQVNLGYRADAAPFSYAEGKQSPMGYSIDVCDAVAAQMASQLGVPNLIVNKIAIDVDRVLSFVKDGAVDMLCSNTSDTPERRATVSFSKPIFFDGVRIAVRKKDSIERVEQLEGKQIVATKSTTTADALGSYARKKPLSWKVETALNPDAALSELQLGWVQGYARDMAPLAVQMARVSAADQYAVLPERLSTEAIAIAFRKDDADMLASVNGVISDSAASGAASALYDKWFVKPIPLGGKTSSLGIPMSAELRASLDSR